jgi:peptidoglycan/LPS O-acetylase OafA/YrhL
VPGIQAGYLGVDVFFVISGFLITGIIVRQIEKGCFSFRSFYLRRARRLLPAAYTTLLLTTALCGIFLAQSQWSDLLEQLLGSLTFTANYVLMMQSGYFEAASESKPLLQMWSLSIEEQFYLLWPALLMLLPRRDLRLWAFILGLVISIVLCLYLSFGAPWGLGGIELSTKAMQKLAFFTLPTRMWELLAGSLAFSLMLHRPEFKLPHWAKQISLFFLVAVCFFPIGTSHPGLDSLIVVALTAVMLVGTDGWIPRALPTNVVTTIGDWSYSLYLIHWPLFAFAFMVYLGDVPATTSALIVLISLLLAWLQYTYVETPFRDGWRATAGRSAMSLISASVLVVAVGGATYLISSHSLPEDMPNFAEIHRVNVGMSAECAVARGVQTPRMNCQSNDSPAIAVLGDSYAMHLVPGLLRADEKNVGLVQLTKSACAPTLGVAHVGSGYSPSWAAECVAFNKAALDYLAKTPSVRLVVVSSSFYQIFSNNGQMLFVNGAVKGFDVNNGIDALADLVEQIQKLGRTVVIVGPSPTDGSDIAACWERLAESKPVWGRDDCRILSSVNQTFSREVNLALKAIADKTKVAVKIPADFLCEGSYCATKQDGVYLYRDRGHFSVSGSEVIVEAMGLLDYLPISNTPERTSRSLQSISPTDPTK